MDSLKPIWRVCIFQLSLDWSYSTPYEKKDLEEYELERSAERGQMHQFHMNKHARKHVLAFEWGHIAEELRAARNETRRMQRRRNMTLRMLPLSRAEEAFEATFGGIRWMNVAGVMRGTGGSEDEDRRCCHSEYETGTRGWDLAASPTQDILD